MVDDTEQPPRDHQASAPAKLRKPRKPRQLDRLTAEQSGVVARRQLNELGFDWDAAQANIDARRWALRTPRVITTFTGVPTVEQRRWIGVLHAGPRSMLGGLTAAARHGLTGWERDEVTVLVDDELSFEPVAGVRFFRSRRPFGLLQSPRPGIPSARLEPAILLWAGYSAATRPAHAVLAAAVQQRLTTPVALVDWVDQLRPLRRGRPFKRTISDIDGGSHSAAELDVVRMCRRAGLSLPARQCPREDSAGRRRWTDCEWDLPDGRVLVLEVDGGLHLDVTQWGEDLKRTRRLVTPTRTIVRCTAYELRMETEQLVYDLRTLGVPDRVPEDAA